MGGARSGRVRRGLAARRALAEQRRRGRCSAQCGPRRGGSGRRRGSSPLGVVDLSPLGVVNMPSLSVGGSSQLGIADSSPPLSLGVVDSSPLGGVDSSPLGIADSSQLDDAGSCLRLRR